MESLGQLNSKSSLVKRKRPVVTPRVNRTAAESGGVILIALDGGGG
jgi:hypothetical protein